MADKPAKYWDYRECAWVTCPAPVADVTVPTQDQGAEPSQADSATAVGSAS